MNTLTASGTCARTWRAPCQSISSSTSRPAASCGSTDCLRGALPVTVHQRVLEEIAGVDHAPELVLADEMVVLGMALAGARDCAR